MKVTDKVGFKVLEEDQGQDIIEFVAHLKAHHEEFRENNVVVDVLKYPDLSINDLLAFMEISKIHRENSYSFVLVTDSVHVDHVPEELVVAPTLTEAGDIIEMEDIERDLGF